MGNTMNDNTNEISDLQEKLSLAVQEISKNHRKIIDDWCKAYLAQLYQENGSIKPGDFILVEQNFHEYNGKLVKKYWFEKKQD